MFSGSPLNRLSWLRPNSAFLNALIVSPASRWILFKSGEPLIVRSGKGQSIAYLTTEDVRSLLGPEPYFGQGDQPGRSLSPEHTVHLTEAARHHHIPLVFLGLHESSFGNCALPAAEVTPDKVYDIVARLDGTAYFSLDVSALELSPDDMSKLLLHSTVAKEGHELDWTEPRSMLSSMDAFTAAIFGEARSMVDWNQRNKFCPGCGSLIYSLWAGWKLSCSSLLPWKDNTGQKPCPTGKGLQNFMHPRSDAVVIMLVIDQTGDKILLGRGKRFPGAFYSALAGFIEPGESFEDAVTRETWEEAGVKVWDVRYYATQPWPFPANIMVGFYARGDPSKPVRIDLDNELADARWFTRDEIRPVLKHPVGTKLGRGEYKKMAEQVEGGVDKPDADAVEKGSTIPDVLDPPALPAATYNRHSRNADSRLV